MTIKQGVKQVPYKVPSDLDAAFAAFISYDNYRRYHMAPGRHDACLFLLPAV